jgi:hypothetical protein
MSIMNMDNHDIFHLNHYNDEIQGFVAGKLVAIEKKKTILKEKSGSKKHTDSKSTIFFHSSTVNESLYDDNRDEIIIKKL